MMLEVRGGGRVWNGYGGKGGLGGGCTLCSQGCPKPPTPDQPSLCNLPHYSHPPCPCRRKLLLGAWQPALNAAGFGGERMDRLLRSVILGEPGCGGGEGAYAWGAAYLWV